MIIDTSKNLIVFLLTTTVLGAVIGYCVALLRAKKRAAVAIADVRATTEKSKETSEADLQSARKSLATMEGSLGETNDRASAAVQREEALEVHAQLQAQRIQTLESQVSSYEDQQIRLQRDFASYKSNKSRELELARTTPDGWSETDQLPVLNKRIDEQDASALHVEEAVIPDSERSQANPSSGSGRVRRGLSKPLSRELDIPSLSESELPDSVDELEFELVDLDGSGEWPRG